MHLSMCLYTCTFIYILCIWKCMYIYVFEGLRDVKSDSIAGVYREKTCGIHMYNKYISCPMIGQILEHATSH